MTSIKDFNKTLMKQLQTYSKVLGSEVQQVAKELAQEASKDVKRDSPQSDTKRKGTYKKDWGIQKVDDGYVVRNKKEYRLTHLLEKGHVTRDGKSRTKAQPHIKPAEEKAIKEFEKRIEEIARGR